MKKTRKMTQKIIKNEDSPSVAPLEPLIEFLEAKPIFLSAVTLYSKRSAYAAHQGTLPDVLSPD